MTLPSRLRQLICIALVLGSGFGLAQPTRSQIIQGQIIAPAEIIEPDKQTPKTLPDATAVPMAAAPQPEPAVTPPSDTQPRALRRPRVETTATLSSGAERVSLYGVIGMGGDSAQSLQNYIESAGDTLTCEPAKGGEYRCLLLNKDDLAMVALRNGAAQARADAPELYLAQEAAAQNERRGGGRRH